MDKDEFLKTSWYCLFKFGEANTFTYLFENKYVQIRPGLNPNCMAKLINQSPVQPGIPVTLVLEIE